MLNNYADDYLLVKVNKDYHELFSSVYFDTPELNMYLEHHNKSANRYKVYKKHRSSTENSQLIIKHTDNKQNTHTKKYKAKDLKPRIPLACFDYINANTKHLAFHLKQVLHTQFNRYLFTNSTFDFLATIDTDLNFWNEHKNTYLTDLVLVNLKIKT